MAQDSSLWNKVWQTQNFDSWDYLSQVIFDELKDLVIKKVEEITI